MFVPNSKISRLNKEIAKLNKKLEKYGEKITVLSAVDATASYSLNREELEFTHLLDATLEDRNALVFFYSIAGKNIELSFPKLAGKEGVTYLGMLESKLGVAQLYSHCDDLHDKVNEALYDTCDHCNINRERVKYYFFEEDGKIKKVGSTCALEYFGLDIEKILNSYENFIATIRKDAEDEINNDDNLYVKFDRLVQAVADTHNNFKTRWVKDESTTLINGALDKDAVYQVTDEDLQKIKEYWDKTPENDFEWNVRNALFYESELTSHVNYKVQGIVSWAIHKALYQVRAVEINEAKNINYLGTVGERIVFTGIPKKVSSYESFYGYVNIYIFELPNAIIKWSTERELEEREYTFKGTVKEHSMYTWQRQTIVTRCKEVLS